jgi:hypothetical protein
VINGVVSLWKTDSMDQGNIVYVWSSLEDHDHNSKYLTMDTPFTGCGVLQTGWDAREDDKSLYLKVEMPGLSKDDVKVRVEGMFCLILLTSWNITYFIIN